MYVKKPYNPQGNLHQGASYILRYIKNRIETKNQNFLCPIIGQTGSGKSYAGLSLLEQLRPGQDLKRNVFFKARTFMERLSDEDSLTKGEPLLWDEIGIDLNAKEWQNLINRMIGKVLQTFRRQNLIVFFTVPYFSFISSDARKLMHAFMRTKNIDMKNNESIIKPYFIQVNEETGKMYKKYLRVQLPGMGLTPIKSMRVPLPSPTLIKWYEEEKKKFAVDLNKTVLDQIIEYEEKNTIKFKENKPQLSSKHYTVLELYNRHKTLDKVGEIMGISHQSVADLLKTAMKRLNIDENGMGIRVFRDFKVSEPQVLSNLPTQPKKALKTDDGGTTSST